jgi:electron transfer flavoprotein alpha subunit
MCVVSRLWFVICYFTKLEICTFKFNLIHWEWILEKIGIIIEVQNGEVKPSNFGVITAAHGIDHELYAFVLDGNGDKHKAVLEQHGIHKVVEIRFNNESLPWNPAFWCDAVIEAVQHFSLNTLIGLTSALGKDLLPRIAAQLDAALIMDCIGLNLAQHTAEKSQFSGRTTAIIKSHGACHIYGIRPNAIDPEIKSVSAQVIPFSARPDNQSLSVKEIKQAGAVGIDLTEADVIISGGRGMENSENFGILRKCAEQMRAAVGASRVAVDAGWVPHAMQVGQTGATVSPKVYIACGIAGSIQHFAGMKTSRMIIAINTDPDAAILKKCDYYAVADLFDIVPLLTSKLKAKS